MEQGEIFVLRTELLQGLDVYCEQMLIEQDGSVTAICAGMLRRFFVNDAGKCLGDKITVRDMYVTMILAFPLGVIPVVNGYRGTLAILDVVAGTTFANEIRKLLQQNKETLISTDILEEEELEMIVAPLADRLTQEEFEAMVMVATAGVCMTLEEKTPLISLLEKNITSEHNSEGETLANELNRDTCEDEIRDFLCVVVRRKILSMNVQSLCLPWDMNVSWHYWCNAPLMEELFDLPRSSLPNQKGLAHWVNGSLANSLRMKDCAIIVTQEGEVFYVANRGEKDMKIELLWSLRV